MFKFFGFGIFFINLLIGVLDYESGRFYLVLYFIGGVKEEGKEKSFNSIFKMLRVIIYFRYIMNREKVK